MTSKSGQLIDEREIQYLFLFQLAFGLAMMLPLHKDISFGLLCVACVPGGGLSHVAVIIADGDTALSLTMNLIGAVAMLGKSGLAMTLIGAVAMLGKSGLTMNLIDLTMKLLGN